MVSCKFHSLNLTFTIMNPKNRFSFKQSIKFPRLILNKVKKEHKLLNFYILSLNYISKKSIHFFQIKTHQE